MTAVGKPSPSLRSRQPFGVVDVLVAHQAAVDGLAQEVRERDLPIVPGARISDAPVDQCAQPQALVQLAREQEAGIGLTERRTGPDVASRIGW
jgi:hypothetical protein